MPDGPNLQAFARVLALIKERLPDYDEAEDGKPRGLRFAVAAGVVPERALDRSTRYASDDAALRTVRLWLDGQNAPSFDALMRMLSRAGLLTEDAVRAYWGEGRHVRQDLEVSLQALERQAAKQPGRARRTQGGRSKSS